ncbi:unnamed protein product [Orchesella dallaii]|uniref:Uncharacterized protein n=1 Tax=Orchesella dallaii TaxID=48710 RepID=A0ABP1QZT6_9HEXA
MPTMPALSYSVSTTNVVFSPCFKFVIPTDLFAPRQSSPGSSIHSPPMSSLSPPKSGFRTQNNVVSSPLLLSTGKMCKDSVRGYLFIFTLGDLKCYKMLCILPYISFDLYLASIHRTRATKYGNMETEL